MFIIIVIYILWIFKADFLKDDFIFFFKVYIHMYVLCT